MNTPETQTVYLVDDDPAVRASLKALLRSVGFQVIDFESAADFRTASRTGEPACLVLDVRMPGQSGLDLQQELLDARDSTPVIMITGHGDIPMSVRAMKAGAVEFLTKPFREQDLLDAIQTALIRANRDRENSATALDLADRLRKLTPRERELIAYVVSGRLNKQIAGELVLSEVTVKVHRGNLMRKMKARSFAELVRMADKLGIEPAPR